MNNPLIDQYASGGPKLAAAIRGLSREQLLAKPIPGKWSIQQVVIHLADSDLILADRMKRVIAEDRPSLVAFDENKFVEHLFYDSQPADQAAQVLALNRSVFTTVLRQLPEAAFSRVGVHSERGEMSLTAILTMASNHLEHHLKFIAEKRAKLEQGVS